MPLPQEVRDEIVREHGYDPTQWDIADDFSSFIPKQQSVPQQPAETVGTGISTIPKLALSAPPPANTPIQTFGKTFLHEAPSAIGGGAAAAGVLTALGGASSLTGAGALMGIPLMIAGGYLGARGVRSIQEAVEPESWRVGAEQAAAENPTAALLGGVATMPLAGFRPGRSTIDALKGGAKLLSGGLERTPAETAAMLNAAINAGLQPVTEVAISQAEGRPLPSAKELALSALIGSTFTTPVGPYKRVFPDVSAPRRLDVGTEGAVTTEDQQSLLNASEQAQFKAKKDAEYVKMQEEKLAQDLAEQQKIKTTLDAVDVEKLKAENAARAVELQQGMGPKFGAAEVRPKPRVVTETGKEIYPDYTGVGEQTKAEAVAESPADLALRREEARLAGEEEPKFQPESALTEEQNISQQLTERGLSGSPSAVMYQKFKEWGAELAGIKLEQDGTITDAQGNPVAGALIAKKGTNELLSKINPNKAGLDTIPHEMLGHGFLRRLRESPRKSDQEFVRKFEELVSKDPEYQRLKAQDANYDPEEFIASKQGLEFIKDRVLGRGETEAKEFWRDLTSHIKTRFTKNATMEDFRRIFNYRGINQPKVKVTGAGEGRIVNARMQPDSALAEDYKRYNELQASIKQMIETGNMDDLQKVWQESENIKNKYGGMPPVAPDAPEQRNQPESPLNEDRTPILATNQDAWNRLAKARNEAAEDGSKGSYVAYDIQKDLNKLGIRISAELAYDSAARSKEGKDLLRRTLGNEKANYYITKAELAEKDINFAKSIDYLRSSVNNADNIRNQPESPLLSPEDERALRLSRKQEGRTPYPFTEKERAKGQKIITEMVEDTQQRVDSDLDTGNNLLPETEKAIKQLDEIHPIYAGEDFQRNQPASPLHLPGDDSIPSWIEHPESIRSRAYKKAREEYAKHPIAKEFADFKQYIRDTYFKGEEPFSWAADDLRNPPELRGEILDPDIGKVSESDIAKYQELADASDKVWSPLAKHAMKIADKGAKNTEEMSKLPWQPFHDQRNQPESALLKQTETPEFKKWFGGSKVVDKDGKPLMLFHTSKIGGLSEFRPLSHFGTKEQAYSLFLGRLRRGEGALKATYPVFLNLKNPKRILDKTNNSVQVLLQDNAPDLYQEFNKKIRQRHVEISQRYEQENAKAVKAWEKRKGWKSGEKRPEIPYESLTREFQHYRDTVLPEEYAPKLIARMEQEGFDGFVYKNEAESDAAIPSKIELEQRPVSPGLQKDSYVAFHPEQIKSATGNIGTFDPNNPDIRYSIKSPLSPIRAEITKVREDFGPLGKIVAGDYDKGFQGFYEQKDLLTGELNGEGLLNPFLNKLNPVEWFVKRTNDDIETVGRKMLAESYGKKSNITLTPRQKEIENTIRQNLLKSVALKNAEPNLRKTIADPNYYPQVPKDEVLNILLNKVGTPEYGKLRKDFYDYHKSIGTPDPAAKFKEFRAGYEKQEVSLASQFGPVDKSAGVGIPPSWAESSPVKVMPRFNNRYARRIAYERAINNHPDILTALDEIQGADVVKNVLQDIQGKTEYNEVWRNAAAGLVRAAMLGPLTGAKDFTSNLTLGLQHTNPLDLSRATVDAIQNFKSNWKNSFETGVNRHNFGTLEIGDGGIDAVSSVLRRSRDIMNSIQGRNILELTNRTIAFGQGKFLAQIAIDAGKKSRLSGQQNKFLQDFAPDWKKAKVTDEYLNKVAGRYARSVQGSYDYRGLPSLTQKGSLAPVLSLARWNVEKFNNFKQYVVEPALKGNITPLLMSTLGMLIGGTAVQKLVEEVTGKKQRSPDWKEIASVAGEPDAKVKEAIAYKLAVLASFSGYAGIMGDLVKSGMDVLNKNTPQTYGNPLLDGLSNAGRLTGELVEALRDGNLDITADVISQILEDYVQGYRLAINKISPERQEKAEATNRRRDLRTWKNLTGQDVTTYSGDRANPFMDKESREFKQTDDLGKAIELLPGLVQNALEKSKGDPEKLESELMKLKRNSYQLFPNPERTPGTFLKYLTYLQNSQGQEAAHEALMDYLMQTEINKVKSSLVPSL